MRLLLITLLYPFVVCFKCPPSYLSKPVRMESLIILNDEANKIPPTRKGPADNDFISSFFSKFLPTPEDIGLSRYDRNSRPENYPCSKDEFALPLPSDAKSPEKLLIRPLLAKTNLEFRDLNLVYDANQDGWRADYFHKKLDKKGPAVVLAKSKSGDVFGGYNPTGWVNYGELRGSIAAFLFVFPKGDINSQPIKLAKIGGAGLAQIDDGQGPRFGSEGLTILLERSNPKQVRSKLGLYYEVLPNGKKTLLSDNKFVDELIDMKVFVGVYGADEKVPYSDAMSLLN